MTDPKTERANARTEADLIKLARKRGYANPEWWAKKVMDGRRKKEKLTTTLTHGGKPI